MEHVGIKIDYVWIVTEWYPKQDQEPIVTAFDNEKAAEDYVRYRKRQQRPWQDYCVDKAPIYSQFKVATLKPNNEED